MPRIPSLLTWLGPGILVAATGVGAGDLATATFAGSKLGTAILWAVLVGAVLKFALNEGLTRWQLATGTTLLEGAVAHLGRFWRWLFLIYLTVWSFLVAMALMNTCGVAANAMVPLFERPETARIGFGVIHSLAAVVLVKLGGFRLFEKVMGLCIGIMFTVVVVTAIALSPPLGELARGTLLPTIPEVQGEGLPWTLALLGGVGGSVTILCYGYWIREEGRHDLSQLKICRWDLATGYLVTAGFGIAMVIIGSRLESLSGSGAGLVVNVADQLEGTLGRWGTVARWAFLIGAWGAFFSSLLGVWQSIPYLFTDLLNLWGLGPDDQPPEVRTDSRTYNLALLGLAIVPIAGLFVFDFATSIKVYSIIGALFIPLLAAMLLILNGRQKWVGTSKNSMLTTLLLVLTLLLFLFAAGFEISKRLA